MQSLFTRHHFVRVLRNIFFFNTTMQRDNIGITSEYILAELSEKMQKWLQVF